jgi:hypothetical protein
MIHLAAEAASFLKVDQVYLALGVLRAGSETVPDLVQPRPLKILFDHLFSSKRLPPAIGSVVPAITGQGSRIFLFFALWAVLAIAFLEAISSYVENLHVVHRPLGHARDAKTCLPTQEQHVV